MPLGHSESPWLMKAIPDEVFRDWAPDLSAGFTSGIVYSAPADSMLKALDYVTEHNGQKYRMVGVDPDNPPEQKNSDWIYRVENGRVSIICYTGHSSSVEFPETLEGKLVTRIENRSGLADECYKGIETVRIPEGYEYIGSNAFCECINLKEISLPVTLKRIGDCAFYKCRNLKEIHLPPLLSTFYHDYETSEGGMFAFWGCNRLERVYISSRSFTYKEAHPFPENVEIIMGDNNRSAKNDAQRIIDEQPIMHVYNFGPIRTKVCIGDIMSLVPGQYGTLDVITADGETAGTLMRETMYTIEEDTYLVNFANMIEAVVVSEIHPYMADDSFDVEIRLKKRNSLHNKDLI